MDPNRLQAGLRDAAEMLKTLRGLRLAPRTACNRVCCCKYEVEAGSEGVGALCAARAAADRSLLLAGSAYGGNCVGPPHTPRACNVCDVAGATCCCRETWMGLLKAQQPVAAARTTQAALHTTGCQDVTTAHAPGLAQCMQLAACEFPHGPSRGRRGVAAGGARGRGRVCRTRNWLADFLKPALEPSSIINTGFVISPHRP